MMFHRKARGYSIIELVVVLGVLAVIIPLMVRFTSETVDIADVQAQRANLYRTTEDAIFQVEDDLSAARSCRTSLMDSPIISIGGTTLEFVADVDDDGDGDYIKYEIISNVMYRTVAVTPDGDTSANGGIGNDDGVVSEDERCSFTAPSNQVTSQLATFPAGTTGTFTAYREGEGSVTARACRGLTSNFDQCDFSSVSVKITQQSLVPDTPDLTIEQEIALDQRWGRT